MIYLDHNATSPLLPEARAAWLEAEDKYPGNPSSPHRMGARAEAALEEAQHQLGQLLGCSGLDIVWTGGATEACNTVIRHAALAGPDPHAPLWLSAVEHPAVWESALHWGPDRVQLLPVDRCGRVELDWIESRLRAGVRPALVAVMAANNETGVLQPWESARELCAAHEVPFFCDATQWCGRLSAGRLGACDFVAGSAHKYGGPRGVGFLKCNSLPLRPLLRGGKQQAGRRAGTENVPGILAMAAALRWCEGQIAARADAERRAWRDDFERELLAAAPGLRVNAGGANRLWNTSSVLMPEIDCRQRWVVKLDKAGFAVSTGSACASGSEKPSHVLTAVGLSAAEAGRALRFSGGWLTPRSDWQALRDALVQAHAALSEPARERDRQPAGR